MSTVCRFRQRRSDIFKVNCLTLKRIAICMDQLESAQNKREKHIKKLLNDFVRVYIITAINEDSFISINHRTMNKFNDASLDTPYNISTLIKYARLINQKKTHTHIKTIRS